MYPFQPLMATIFLPFRLVDFGFSMNHAGIRRRMENNGETCPKPASACISCRKKKRVLVTQNVLITSDFWTSRAREVLFLNPRDPDRPHISTERSTRQIPLHAWDAAMDTLQSQTVNILYLRNHLIVYWEKIRIASSTLIIWYSDILYGKHTATVFKSLKLDISA